MARPEVSELAEQLYAALGFFREADEDNDWALLRFCAAWASPLDPVYGLVAETDTDAPWAVLFDVENCPVDSLPYLAQYVGVTLTPDMSEEDQRAAIREPVGWSRGRTASIEISALPTLTGTRRVVIKPREPEVGIHYIRTLASETPNPNRTEGALRAAVPAWEFLDYQAFTAFTYDDLDAGYKDYAAVKAAFATYGDVIDASL